MEQGRIIKGVGGFYDVLTENGAVVTCKARGRFRNEHIAPMVGDLVDISHPKTGMRQLTNAFRARNAWFAPSVANIDQLISCRAGAPKPDWLLIDKLLLQCHALKIEPLLVLNKIDMAKKRASEFRRDYAAFPFAARFVEDGRRNRFAERTALHNGFPALRVSPPFGKFLAS
jgi:ribosome biogenesis GTPase